MAARFFEVPLAGQERDKMLANGWNYAVITSYEQALAELRAITENWRVKPKPAADRRGVVECPCCKSRLHLSQSSYNGHVHGKCETEGCVSWME